MDLPTFKIGKKEFVVVPRRRFDQLTRAERDQKDADIARKGREDWLAGRVQAISHEQLKRELGL